MSALILIRTRRVCLAIECASQQIWNVEDRIGSLPDILQRPMYVWVAPASGRRTWSRLATLG
jgi:hypothetical protein